MELILHVELAQFFQKKNETSNEKNFILRFRFIIIIIIIIILLVFNEKSSPVLAFPHATEHPVYTDFFLTSINNNEYKLYNITCN